MLMDGRATSSLSLKPVPLVQEGVIYRQWYNALSPLWQPFARKRPPKRPNSEVKINSNHTPSEKRSLFMPYSHASPLFSFLCQLHPVASERVRSTPPPLPPPKKIYIYISASGFGQPSADLVLLRIMIKRTKSTPNVDLAREDSQSFNNEIAGSHFHAGCEFQITLSSKCEQSEKYFNNSGHERIVSCIARRCKAQYGNLSQIWSRATMYRAKERTDFFRFGDGSLNRQPPAETSSFWLRLVTRHLRRDLFLSSMWSEYHSWDNRVALYRYFF